MRGTPALRVMPTTRRFWNAGAASSGSDWLAILMDAQAATRVRRRLR